MATIACFPEGAFRPTNSCVTESARLQAIPGTVTAADAIERLL